MLCSIGELCLGVNSVACSYLLYCLYFGSIIFCIACYFSCLYIVLWFGCPGSRGGSKCVRLLHISLIYLVRVPCVISSSPSLKYLPSLRLWSKNKVNHICSPTQHIFLMIYDIEGVIYLGYSFSFVHFHLTSEGKMKGSNKGRRKSRNHRGCNMEGRWRARNEGTKRNWRHIILFNILHRRSDHDLYL